MQFEMFSEVRLKEALPEYNIAQNSSAIIVDYLPRPEGQEDGYILEVLDNKSQGYTVIAVTASKIEPVIVRAI